MRRLARAGGAALRPTVATCVFLSVAAAACAAARDDRLAPADVAAIRAADSAYVAAWLRDDTVAVLATLASDAVLMPAGQHPLATRAAIEAFWWPRDGSRTTLLAFVRAIDEIGGSGNVAYLRGSDSIAFRYEKGVQRSTQSVRTMSLALLAREPDGRWRIKRMMWGTRQ